MDNLKVDEQIRIDTNMKLKGKIGDIKTINLIADYLIGVQKLGFLPEGVSYKDLLDRLDERLTNIIFFSEDDPINDQYGHDFRGVTENNGCLYIRDSRADKEIVFFHELTHILIKRPTINLNGKERQIDGLVSVKYYGEENNNEIKEAYQAGCIVSESIVQYIADSVYNNKHGIKQDMKTYSSKDLRFLDGFSIESDLSNYQVFDSLARKYLEIKGKTRQDAARIAFDANKEKVDKLWEEDELDRLISEKLGVPLQLYLDIIYETDKLYYTQPEFKEKLEAGSRIGLINQLEGLKYHVSLQNEFNQYKCINEIFDIILENLRKERNGTNDNIQGVSKND